MAADDIVEQLECLNVSNPDCLLFNSPENQPWLERKFGEIPRYLFRVFTPKSCGFTDLSWTKSKDARYVRPSSEIDIFRRRKNDAAGMLVRHLRWWSSEDDNLVSWTSSLLFALYYMFHLHIDSRDASAFADISLCVVDTTLFPQGVFLRDMDLIEAFQEADSQLRSFGELRRRRSRTHRGTYYFGEYLSQGALKIQDKCQIVLADSLINNGLYHIHPELEEFGNRQPTKNPPWANPVIQFREKYDAKMEKFQKINEPELQAILSIAGLFETGWRMVMAASFVTLLSGQDDEYLASRILRAIIFTDHEKRDCSPEKTKIMEYDTLPEVRRFAEIMVCIYNEYCYQRAEEQLKTVEITLRHAILHLYGNKISASKKSLIMGRFDTVTLLCDALKETLLE